MGRKNTWHLHNAAKELQLSGVCEVEGVCSASIHVLCQDQSLHYHRGQMCASDYGDSMNIKHTLICISLFVLTSSPCEQCHFSTSISFQLDFDYLN